jgi:NAD-dependent histone deacetylase SIR2
MDKAKEADLILVMGTSLQVHPFAGLPNLADEEIPRVLFNLERVGSFGTQADDVMVLGDCDAGIRMLADELGWRDELEAAWRELVGDDEAERQMQGAKKRVAALHDEVSKLAEEVEEVLHIDDAEAEAEGEKEAESKDAQQRRDQEVPAATPAGDAAGSGEAHAKPAVDSRLEDKPSPPAEENQPPVQPREKVDAADDSAAKPV